MNKLVMLTLPISARMEPDPNGCYQIRDPVYADYPLEAMAKIFGSCINPTKPEYQKENK